LPDVELGFNAVDVAVLAIELNAFFDVTVMCANAVRWKDPVQTADDTPMVFKPVIQLLDKVVDYWYIH